MKSPEHLVAEARRRLETTWDAHAVGAGQAWPHKFPLGAPDKKSALESGWQTTIHPLIRTWRDWAAQHPVRLHTTPRQVFTTVQEVPTHLEIGTAVDAAAIVGGNWTERLERGRRRAVLLAERFPATAEPGRIIRAADSYTDTDFALLLDVATWFTRNDASGFTPRQVPIPGVHAKWLNTHQQLILKLADREALGLLPAHPSRIHFTYLDPCHRLSGGRIHDSATVGDTMKPAYPPRIVIISENKDTAIHFPRLSGGIAVEGSGAGGKSAAAFDWLTSAPHLLYWGDIDAYGLEIINGWRQDGVPASSILMDLATYEAYERYGTNTDKNGQPLKAGEPKALPHLTDAERALYHRLLDPVLAGHRRIEQERIPLNVALAAVETRTRDRMSEPHLG